MGGQPETVCGREGCGTRFVPDDGGGDAPALYCGQACRRAAKKKRQRRARQLAACTAMNKQAWTDGPAATLAAARYESQFGGHRYPYECPCGVWHLTSQPPDARKRARDIKLILFGEATEAGR
jgi:hypothetical protein